MRERNISPSRGSLLCWFGEVLKLEVGLSSIDAMVNGFEGWGAPRDGIVGLA
jgi:hypothetical protein